MSVYSIRDLEKLSGIKAHTIRIWEKRYNLIEPRRTGTNIRYYNNDDLKKILNVATLNRHGIKISRIARLNDLEMKEEIMRISDLTSSHAHTIDAMIIAMIDFDEPKFLTLIEKNTSRLGFRDTVVNLLYPFLIKVGILWQAGDINPSQEHFASNLIREKIIAATDALPSIFNPDGKKFLLFLPEDEWHEIGLLFAHYLLKVAGHEVVYLGQSISDSEIPSTAAAVGADFLLLSITVMNNPSGFIHYLRRLGEAVPDKKIVFFSNLSHETTSDLPKSFIPLQNLENFLNFMKKLQA